MPVLRTRDQGDSPTISTYLPPGPVPERWNDLFAGYHMDEGVGADRVDVLGARDLNDVVNNVPSQAAKFDDGAQFTVSGSELNRVTTDFAFPGDWTIALWMKNITGWGAFSEQWMSSSGPAGVDWMFFTGSGIFNVQAVDTNGSSTSVYQASTYMPVNNTLYFVAVTYDSVAKTLRGSVDGGNFVTGAVLPNGMRTQGTQLRLRCIPTFVTPWVADELHFFTAKKSDAWMTDMYNGGAGRLYPG